MGSLCLAVFSRILTTISNSWAHSWRQWGGRYAIHTRRNLPAKGLRYLRTVRVTAAIHHKLQGSAMTNTQPINKEISQVIGMTGYYMVRRTPLPFKH